MKKLYRRSVTVHPSPPPPPPPTSDHNHLLSLLPAAILALTAALSPQDREVLAYLVSSNNSHFNSSNRGKNRSSNCDHPPCFTCDCFRCYMSYWVRWDSSPNRQLIHEVIDAFEDGLVLKNKNKNQHRSVKGKNGRDRRNNRSGPGAEQPAAELKRPEPSPSRNESADKKEEANAGGGEVGSGGEEELEKGSVRKLVSFIGERIWGAWN